MGNFWIIRSENYLAHHGILGQKWGVRRYQNEDGTLTEEGKKRLEEKDNKWAKKNYDKIYNNAYKKSEKEVNKYAKKELNKTYPLNKDGSLSAAWVNAYNKKLAEVMNTKVSDVQAPSGKVIRFVAKRGELGVHLALADAGYDLSQVKNGVFASGKIAYKKKNVEVG